MMAGANIFMAEARESRFACYEDPESEGCTRRCRVIEGILASPVRETDGRRATPRDRQRRNREAEVLTETLTLTKIAVPDFARRLYEDVDEKRFGEAFDLFLTEDAVVHFGVGRWQGRETIRERFRSFNDAITTRHKIVEFWDGGLVKIFRGEIDMTNTETGEVLHPTIVHFWYMSPEDPSKVCAIYAGVGPIEAPL